MMKKDTIFKQNVTFACLVLSVECLVFSVQCSVFISNLNIQH